MGSSFGKTRRNGSSHEQTVSRRQGNHAENGPAAVHPLNVVGYDMDSYWHEARIVRTEQDHSEFGPPFTVFHMQVKRGNQSWECRRRYRDFNAFHEVLQEAFPDVAFPPFPPKRLFGSTHHETVAERVRMLNVYLDFAIHVEALADSDLLATFLYPKTALSDTNDSLIQELREELEVVKGEEQSTKLLFESAEASLHHVEGELSSVRLECQRQMEEMAEMFAVKEAALLAELDEAQKQAQHRENALHLSIQSREVELEGLCGQMNQLEEQIRGLQDERDGLRERAEQIDSIAGDAADLTAQLETLQAHFAEARSMNGSLTTQLREVVSKVSVLEADRRDWLASQGEDAPTGEVTLVFTDVQGSTTQWEKNPDVMAVALGKHNSLMRKLIREQHGYEVKTEGDAFMVSFGSPDDALRWCLHAQEKLVELDWPTDLLTHKDSAAELAEDGTCLYRGLRVRMGCHLGMPKCEPDPTTGRMDYFGPMVNRAARVGGSAQGGQVLVSGNVWNRVFESLSSLGSPRARELGWHRLKGLDTDERLVEVLPQTLEGRQFALPGVAAAAEASKKMEDQLRQLKEENTKLQRQLGEMESSLERANSVALTLSARATALRRGRGADAEHRLTETLEEMDAMLIEQKRYQDQHTHAMDECTSLCREIEDLRGLIDERTRDAVEREELMGETIRWLTQEKTQQENALQQTTGDLTSLKDELARRTQELSTSESNLEELHATLARIQTSHTSDLESHTAELEGLRTILTQRDEEINELRDISAKSEGVLEDVAALKQQLETLQAQLAEARSMNGSLTTQLREVVSKVSVLEADRRDWLASQGEDAPTGEVTLVFTDVQGSTTQWEKNPDVMAVALGKHNSLMRKLIREQHGYEVKTEGDAFMVSFGSPDDALRWCLHAQEKLVELDWPTDLLTHKDSAAEVAEDGTCLYRGLRVRMGCHLGTPKCEPDPTTGRMDYFGPMVNRAARVGGSAQGGQVLVSGNAWNRVFESLSSLGSPRARELGWHRLKGLDTDERLVEVLPQTLEGRQFALPGVAAAAEASKKMEDQLRQLKEENTKLQRQLEEMESSLERANSVALTLSARATALRRGRGADAEHRLTETLEEMDAMLIEQKRYQDQHTHAMDECTSLCREIEDLRGLIDERTRDAVEREELMGETIRWLTQEKTQQENALQQTTGDLTSLKDELARRTQELSTSESNLEELHATLARIQTSHTSDLESHTAELEGLRTILTQRDEEINELRDISAKSEGVLEDVAALKQQLETLQAQLAEARSMNGSLTTQLREVVSKVSVLEADRRDWLASQGEDAPTGEVTLVFTDVQGSTTQWEKNPDVMAVALGKHNSLMRKLIREQHGYEVKTEGDAFMVSFGSPDDALRWCLHAQEKLVELDWPTDLLTHKDSAAELAEDGTCLYRGLRVRMGCHLGVPKCEPDPTTGRMDYFGPMVNRAARVGGSAQGGQVLVSGNVWNRVFESLSSLGSPRARELGWHRLKGLDTDERLVEVLPQTLEGRQFALPGVAAAAEASKKMEDQLRQLKEENTKLQRQLGEMESSLERANSVALTLSARATALRRGRGPNIERRLQEALVDMDATLEEQQRLKMQHEFTKSGYDSMLRHVKDMEWQLKQRESDSQELLQTALEEKRSLEESVEEMRRQIEQLQQEANESGRIRQELEERQAHFTLMRRNSENVESKLKSAEEAIENLRLDLRSATLEKKQLRVDVEAAHLDMAESKRLVRELEDMVRRLQERVGELEAPVPIAKASPRLRAKSSSRSLHLDSIDTALAEWVLRNEARFPAEAIEFVRCMLKIAPGVYAFGSRRVNLMLVGGEINVRVGGGFAVFSQFVQKNWSREAARGGSASTLV